MYLSDIELSKRYKVSRLSIWRWARAKKTSFPQPIKLSAGCSRWRLSDIEEWENKRAVA